jgi:Holliday junction resolvasome RuvABC DNA-binding subunit
VNLGYQRIAAEKALDAASQTLGAGASFEAILKQALRVLAK